jgi:hypothetical protein
MNAFLQRHLSAVTGILSGLDRVRFRGTMRMLAHTGGFASFLRIIGVKIKDFGDWVDGATEEVNEATRRLAAEAGREVIYEPRPSASKEQIARAVAARDGIDQGLVCVIKCVEPCFSYNVRKWGSPELRGGTRRCLHYYHYMIDPYFGWMHVRVQSWMPMTMHVCINGREWLARRMDPAGFTRADNCFTRLADPAAAQTLFDTMLQTDWPKELDRLAAAVNPARAGIMTQCPVDYYWSTEECEWASDVMFKDAAGLAGVYPNLVRHGMLNLNSQEVLRFLGKKVSPAGAFSPTLKAEVSTDLRRRIEGVRIKHRVGPNSVKMYDKQGSVLRVETTINKPKDMKVYRPKEGDPDGKKEWRPVRKGVADLFRLGEVCQGANDRYLTALAAADQPTPLKDLAEKLCDPVRWQGGRARGLNPLGKDDAALLAAVNDGRFTLAGFRNRDLRDLLDPDGPKGPAEKRRVSAAVTRKLRLLRAHGLIAKVPKTHRYKVSDKGMMAINALLAARLADTAKLSAAA